MLGKEAPGIASSTTHITVATMAAVRVKPRIQIVHLLHIVTAIFLLGELIFISKRQERLRLKSPEQTLVSSLTLRRVPLIGDPPF